MFSWLLTQWWFWAVLAFLFFFLWVRSRVIQEYSASRVWLFGRNRASWNEKSRRLGAFEIISDIFFSLIGQCRSGPR